VKINIWSYGHSPAYRAVNFLFPQTPVGSHAFAHSIFHLRIKTFDWLHTLCQSEFLTLNRCFSAGSCPSRDIPTGLSVDLPRITYVVGDKVTYTCKGEGFAINGTSTSVCTSSGEWSTPIPTCLSKHSIELLYYYKISSCFDFCVNY